MRQVIVPRKPPGFELFTTGAWCISQETSPRPPFRGSGWYIGTRRYEFKGSFPSEEIEKFHAAKGFNPQDGRFRKSMGEIRSCASALELVIFARSLDTAQRAANLLFVGYLLIHASSIFLDHLVALPDKYPEPEFMHYRLRSRQQTC